MWVEEQTLYPHNMKFWCYFVGRFPSGDVDSGVKLLINIGQIVEGLRDSNL